MDFEQTKELENLKQANKKELIKMQVKAADIEHQSKMIRLDKMHDIAKIESVRLCAGRLEEL